MKEISSLFKSPLSMFNSSSQSMKNFFTKLFKGSIIESIIVLIMVLAVSFFTKSIIPVIPVALLVLGKNFFLRAISLSFKRSCLPFKNAMIIVINFLMAAQFAFLFNALAITLLHEMGHALAAYGMYVNPSPLINIFPFAGGETSYITDKLSLLGSFFGEKTAKAIIAGAGCFITLMFSFLLLFFARKKKQSSQLYAYLTTTAIYGLAADALYASSAMKSTSAGHDFLGLWEVGIHPLFSTFFLLLAPFLFSLLMKVKSLKKSKQLSY